MQTIKRVEVYNATAGDVFMAIDDLGITGNHMTQSSTMMAGSKLNLEFLSANKSGPGTKYRWSGKMMGFKMDFTVEVTKWVSSQEKIWETVGKTRLIIYSWYRMHLQIKPVDNGAQAKLSISYEKPTEWYNRFLSFLFARWYCEWCLRKMLGDAKKYLAGSGSTVSHNIS